MCQSDWIEVGYVTRAHGLRGEVRIRTHNEASSILEETAELSLVGPGERPWRSFSIRSARHASGSSHLVCLLGVSERTEAEALVGARVMIKRQDFPDLEEGEYYHCDLIGLQVVDETRKPLGRVDAVYTTPANDVFVIRGPEIGELMVPAVGTYVDAIDIKGGAVTLKNLDNLLEV